MTLMIRHTDVLGGIVGGFPPLVPFVGWRQYAVAATYTDPDGLELPAFKLLKLSGPDADTWSMNQARTAQHFVDRVWPYSNTDIKGSFPGLAWYLMDPTTFALVGGPLLPLGNAGNRRLSQQTRDIAPQTEHYVQWFDHTTPITGPYIAVQVAREPSDDFPLFVSGHPVEIAASLLDDKGEAYDAASATAVTAAMGPVRHIMPVTSPDQTPQDMLDQLSQAYGFAIRRSIVSGDAEFVYWREKLGDISALPVLDTNALRSEGGPTFELADASRLTRVRVNGKVIAPWEPGTRTVRDRVQFHLAGPPTVYYKTVITNPNDKPASGLTISSAEVVFDYSTDGVTADADIYGEQEASVDLAGMPGVDNAAGGVSQVNLEQFGEGVARLLFDTHSRGRQHATVVTRRNTDADLVFLGDPLNLTLTHLPNAQIGRTPTSQRDPTARPFRVVERTEELLGPVLRLADEGTGVQYGTVPSIAVALDSNVAGQWIVTVSNAATLTADGAQVEFQCKVFGPSDTPDFTDPGFRYTIRDATTWTGTDIRFGPFPLTHQVHFRARAFLFGGSASAWSSWDGVGGGGVTGSISSLTAGTLTSSSAAYSWTNTNTTAEVRVQLKLDTETDYSLIVDLPPGSTAFVFTGLTAETDYDARFILVQGGTEVGSALTDSFTTDLVANQGTLTVPSNPTVYGGLSRPSGIPSPGTYGLEVDAVFGPPDLMIVFEEAVETAVGSGTPGSYAVVWTTPAVVGDVTRYESSAPNDLKLRYLRAYATATGWTDSATTTALAIDPWSNPPVVSGGSALLTPPTALLRLFGFAPDVLIESPSGGGVTDAQYLVGAAHAGLSAERVVTDTSTIAWDLGTAGQAKANYTGAAPGHSLNGYIESFDAITDDNNDNFATGSLDTGGTRFTGANGWTWLNQGTATATQSAGKLWLRGPSEASLNVRGVYLPLPGGNWLFRATVEFRDDAKNTGQSQVGLFLRDSTTGKLEVFGPGFSGGARGMWTAKWNSATSFGSTRAFSALGFFMPTWLEIEYDGTNYTYRSGQDDGVATIHWGTVPDTDFLTVAADQIGLFTMCDSSDPTTCISREFFRVTTSVTI